jgi:CRISPR-associated protein Csb2
MLVSVPREGSVAAMDAHYRAWVGKDGGASVQRAQFPALRHVIRYEAAGERESATPTPQPTLLCVRFADPEAAVGASISGRRVAAVTEAFKAAVLRLFQDHVDEPPPVLTGHGMEGSGYHLAYYLALPNVGAPHATGRIHGLALCLPPGTDPKLVDACRGVLDRMDHLVGRGFQRVPCSLWAGERRPWATNPGRWVQTAQVWATAFPAVYERRSTDLDNAEVSGWCRHAGIETAVREVRVSRVPILAGGVDLAPVEVNRVGRPGKPYAHLELTFAEPVRGPVVVGGARQRGLGLCAPIRGEGLSGG